MKTVYILVKNIDEGGLITDNRFVYETCEDAVNKNIDLITTGKYDVVPFLL